MPADQPVTLVTIIKPETDNPFHFTVKSKFCAQISEHIPGIDSALLIAAVDFQPGSWAVEHYVLIKDLPNTIGLQRRCHNSMRFDAATMMPSLDEEIASEMQQARGDLSQYIFEKDRDLFRDLGPIGQLISDPLTPGILGLYCLRGPFVSQLQEIASSTECESLRQFLGKRQVARKLAVQDLRPKDDR